MPKELHIQAIKEGTTIDHIPIGKALKIAEILCLENLESNAVAAIALNVESKKMGRKDLVFIENKNLTEDEVNKIALIAEGATLNLIKGHEVTRKTKILLPKLVEGILSCINPTCITNHETITTRFSIQETPLKASCFYCEKTMNKEEISKAVK